MTPQEHSATATTHRRRLTYAMVLMMIALLFFLGIHLFAGIREITVLGNGETYTEQSLIDSSQIRLGKRIYGIDEEEAAQRILQQHPILESVRIDKKGFFGVLITVQEKKPLYYVEYGGLYYTLSEDLCVLKEQTTLPTTDSALLQLILPEIHAPAIGNRLTLLNDNSDYIMRFTNELRQSTFYSQLTSLNLTEKYNLKAFYNQSLEFRFGNYQNLDKKCDIVENWLVTASPSLYSEFDVSDPERPRSQEIIN